MKEFALANPYLTTITVVVVAYFVCQSAVWIVQLLKK